MARKLYVRYVIILTQSNLVLHSLERTRPRSELQVLFLYVVFGAIRKMAWIRWIITMQKEPGIFIYAHTCEERHEREACEHNRTPPSRHPTPSVWPWRPLGDAGRLGRATSRRLDTRLYFSPALCSCVLSLSILAQLSVSSPSDSIPEVFSVMLEAGLDSRHFNVPN